LADWTCRRKRPADWAAFSAPQLFIQRARRVYLGFDSAAEREAILHICQLVGGLPLALELAAAWVRTVPCRDIAAAIERHLDFLTQRLRNMPERQRSLRAAFDYSWELLPEAEQTMLARLAVFRGGFDGEAARPLLKNRTNRAGRGDLMRKTPLSPRPPRFPPIPVCGSCRRWWINRWCSGSQTAVTNCMKRSGSLLRRTDRGRGLGTGAGGSRPLLCRLAGRARG
jgi:hypothetical protein